MKLTKAQVIALFIAASKANTDIVVTMDELINGNCSADTVAPGTPTSVITECSSLTACANDSECTGTANEKCGSFVQDGQDTVSKCVYQRACDNVGRINNVHFSIQCWNSWNGELPKELPNALTYFDNVASLVGQNGIESFKDVKNMKIPSKSNFQTGWWIRQDNSSAIGIYAETDKPVNNKCVSNGDCAENECCANWPDTNNKRCTDKTNGGIEQIILPFSAFTPICASNGNGAPISAKVDLGKEAQAQAAQAVDDFHVLNENAAKTDSGYVAMSDEDKAAYDAKRAAMIIERKAFDDADREAAGYDSMDNDIKAIYDAELLKWKMKVYENCNAKKESISCRKANEIRASKEIVRKINDYYKSTTSDREALDFAQFDVDKKTIASLTAAWVQSNVPAAGQPGSSCSGASKCIGIDHCCGTATPSSNAPGVNSGQREGVCASQTDKKFSDNLGISFSHVCGAQKLVAAAGAILAAVYLM